MLFYESKDKYFIDGYFAWIPDENKIISEDAHETYNYWLNLYGHSKFD
jgi:hypothetical protein